MPVGWGSLSLIVTKGPVMRKRMKVVTPSAVKGFVWLWVDGPGHSGRAFWHQQVVVSEPHQG